MDNQVGFTEKLEEEWPMDKVLSHKGSGCDAMFEMLWKSGDMTWLPYERVSHLQQLQDYLDVLGIKEVSGLHGDSMADDENCEDQVEVFKNEWELKDSPTFLYSSYNELNNITDVNESVNL